MGSVTKSVGVREEEGEEKSRTGYGLQGETKIAREVSRMIRPALFAFVWITPQGYPFESPVLTSTIPITQLIIFVDESFSVTIRGYKISGLFFLALSEE